MYVGQSPMPNRCHHALVFGSPDFRLKPFSAEAIAFLLLDPGSDFDVVQIIYPLVMTNIAMEFMAHL